MFPGQEKRFEWWSPKAGPSLSAQFKAVGKELGSDETEVHFIVNEDYAERVRILFERASIGTKATPEPFFRSLQILTHVAGSSLHWDPPIDAGPP
jgi:hypothetical protein